MNEVQALAHYELDKIQRDTCVDPHHYTYATTEWSPLYPLTPEEAALCTHLEDNHGP